MPPATTNMRIFNYNDAFDARKKYTRFRILVIGRANAGKTTLLKRVCSTAEEPCIYDEKNNNLVRLLPVCCFNPTTNHSTITDQSNCRGTLFALRIIPSFSNLHQARNPRHQPSIRLCQQPPIYLPWFSRLRDWRRIPDKASPRLHCGTHQVHWSQWPTSCHLVGQFLCNLSMLQVAMLTCRYRYCFEPNQARLLLDSDKKFFQDGVAGNGF